MRTELPDEHGWYWCKLLHNDEWCMAFVDTCEEHVLLFGGENGLSGPSRHKWDQRSLERNLGIIQWYGPITCPGGDFGSTTVIIDEERHLQAALEKKAIVLTYVDLRYCKEDGGSNITFIATVSQEDAKAYIDREVSKFKEEATHDVATVTSQSIKVAEKIA